MNDIAARADRVRAVVEGNHGKVTNHNGDVIEFEVPADIATGLYALWGMGGFLPMFIGQSARLAPRRVLDREGRTVVCDDSITMAFYRYRINLTEQAGTGLEAPLPAGFRPPPSELR